MVKVAGLCLAAVFSVFNSRQCETGICGCRDDRDSPIVSNL